MEYTTFKDINNISKLGFGAMRFPKKEGKIDQEQVDAMIKHAYDTGVTYYDTAYVYGEGESEIVLGKALKQFPRDSYYLSDKFPYYRLKSLEQRDVFFNESLDRCGVDYFDFYLIHAVNAKEFPMIAEFDVINWALQKKKEGKIKYLGVSMHDKIDLLDKLIEICDWDFVQIQYNYMDLNHEPGQKGYIRLCEKNIPIVIMEPLKGGLLAQIPSGADKPFSDLGGSNVSYSFRWLAEHKNIFTILSGMSNLEQTVENCKIFEEMAPLTNEEHKAIIQVEQNIISKQKIGCTGCNYCMPCPVGIDIPAQFKAWNTKSFNTTGNWISGADINLEMIKKCIECGKCVGHCPQKLDIPKGFKDILSENNK